MNLNLNYEGFETNLVRKFDMDGGIQYRFRFKNHYGASVIKHDYSYGHKQDLWEIAVIRYYRDDEWYITYDTDITDDVIGYLSDEEVREILKRISELNNDKKEKEI